MAQRTEAARTRRRGSNLEAALRDAALAELAEVGYAGLTMEGVAKRAETGKAALYRRWPSKAELVLDALRQVLPDPRTAGPASALRAGFVAALTGMADVLAGRTAAPGFGVLAEISRVPELRNAFADAVIRPRMRFMQELLDAAVERGEIAAAVVTPMTVRVGPALVLETFMHTGEPPPPEELELIADTVLRPLGMR
ncbi:TetR/AcrR family transcriptional regulator [Nocardia sp. NPDC052566]|uniref:TetR/AcrR family transcriptional regulator n=1 Tax=Nocardia sp. NPDC052566 TaxID=3364330 RepID=UPI0037C56D88